MRTFFFSACFIVVSMFAFISNASAAFTVDGVKSPNEYAGAQSFVRDSWINGSNASGGFLRSTRYFALDANNVYLAFEADTSFMTTVTNDNGTPGDTSDDTSQLVNAFANRAFNGVNAYVYSSGVNPRVGGGSGTYGDDDDIIVETTTRWGYAENNDTSDLDGNPWFDFGGALVNVPTTGVHTDVISGIIVGYTGGNSNIYEVSIPRNLVDASDYMTLRVGGQAWAYGFTYNNAVVPEPALLASIAACSLIALRRRRA